MTRSRYSSIESLEARIAPATLVNPLSDIVASIGKTGATIDMGHMYDTDTEAGYRTHVEFITNFDTDPLTEGVQAGKIVIELFDDKAPITVQNFLAYVQNAKAKGDYDGTFFHRSISGFVLQGGGYDVSDLKNGIITGTPVHNEFDASDAERSNVAGTIAMAKTALSANSATSEFFFNLSDNSGNLDNQNGGFTVFGKVVQGMDVVNAIASLSASDLSTITGNSALTNTPVQGGYNASSGVAPTAAQLVQITDAHIIAPHNGVSEGLKFTTTITDVNGHATSLVTAKITGDTLTLKYKPGATGVAKVSVTALDQTGNIVGTDDFSVTVRPNLIATEAGDTLPSVLVPGDKGLVKVNISNTSGGVAAGKVNVKFYLSQATDADPYATLLDDIGGADKEIGGIYNRAVSIASGKSISLIGQVQVPQELVASQGEYYRILAVVTSPDGSRHIAEVGDYTDDNVSFNGSVHQIYNVFGSFQANGQVRTNVPLTYLDANGKPVTVTLKGGGYGQLSVGEDGAIDLYTSDTSAASQLAVKTRPGLHTDLRNVSIDGGDYSIGAVSLPTVDLHGDFIAAGGLKSLTLGNLSGTGGNSHGIAISAFAEKPLQTASIKLGKVSDYNLESAMPVSALSVLEWSNTEGSAAETLTFSKLTNFFSQRDLEANVNITDSSLVKTFTVGGVVSGANIHVTGDMGRVTLGAIQGSKFMVGTTGDTVPTALSDFTAERSVASFIVKGIAGRTYAMSDSVIAASKFGAISIKSVDPTEGAADYGVIADLVTHYQRGPMKLSRLDAAAELDVKGGYSLTVLETVA